MLRTHIYRLMLGASLLDAVGCTRVAVLEWSSPPPPRLYDNALTALPPLIFKDSGGKVLTEAPSLVWRSSRPGVITVDAGQLTVVSNGSTTISVQVADSDVRLEHRVEVALVDKVVVRCGAPDCTYPVGQEARLEVTASSGGTQLPDAVARWDLEGAGTRAKLIGPGRVQATHAGPVGVRATLGAASSVLPIRFIAPIDRIELRCPAAFLAETAPGQPAACRVPQARTLTLEASAWGQGEATDTSVLEWSSSDREKAYVAAGNVTAVGIGAVVITARYREISATLDLEVSRGCVGTWSRQEISVPVRPGALKRGVRTYFDLTAVWTRLPNVELCIDQERVRGLDLEAALAACCAQRDVPEEVLREQGEFSGRRRRSYR